LLYLPTTDLHISNSLNISGDVITDFAGTGLTVTSGVLDVDASQTQITAVGTIATGVWEGTTIAINQGGTGATSLDDILGTANEITVGGGANTIIGGDVTLSLPNELQLTQASTTLLSVFDTAYFGGTATSTFNSLGDLLVVGSTTLQNFTALNATTTNATTTDLHISNSLNISGDIITDFAGTNLTIDSSGVLNAAGGGSGDPFAWTATTNYGAVAVATTTPVWFQASPFSLFASTTAVFVNATTTQLETTDLFISGDVINDFAGVGLSVSTNVLTFDATEIDAVTWSDNANVSNVWTFDVSGTDTTATWGSALLTLSHALDVTTSVTALNFVADGATATSTFAGGLTVDGTDFVVDPDGGRVGIGIASPATTLEILDTTEQLRLTYDSSNYASFTVASDGALTLTTTGTDEDIL